LETWGSDFADVAITGTDLLVSLYFKQAWDDSGLTGLSGFEVADIVKVKAHRKPAKDPPRYFRATVCRSATAINLVASRFEWDKPPTCPVCCLGDNVRRWEAVVVNEQAWTGEDVFLARGLAGTIIASDRFKEFCERSCIKNAVLVPAEKYEHDFYAGG
jgi:hypothetical protein